MTCTNTDPKPNKMIPWFDMEQCKWGCQNASETDVKVFKTCLFSIKAFCPKSRSVLRALNLKGFIENHSLSWLTLENKQKHSLFQHQLWWWGVFCGLRMLLEFRTPENTLQLWSSNKTIAALHTLKLNNTLGSSWITKFYKMKQKKVFINALQTLHL